MCYNFVIYGMSSYKNVLFDFEWHLFKKSIASASGLGHLLKSKVKSRRKIELTDIYQKGKHFERGGI